MVLESVIGEKRIRQKPFLMALIAFAVSVASIYFADQLFPQHGSVLSVAFITIAIVPIMHNILSSEEAEELLERRSSATFFARHFNLIMLYVWVFVAIVVAFAFAYSFSPVEERRVWFAEQTNAFCNISSSDSCVNGSPVSINGNSISGKATGAAFDACQNTNNSTLLSCATYIFNNNFGVLIFILILSILYGAGSIFIIAWNASIIGVFFGEMFLVGQHIKGFGFLQGMLIGHGPPELLSYVFAALAGAILSAAISKGDFFRNEGGIIFKDILFLVALAVFSVFYGAAVEGIGMMGLSDLYYILGFVYVMVIIVAVFIYGKREHTSSKFSY
jgi:uncharacterized membrane protein SpoIIM required for sporulation